MNTPDLSYNFRLADWDEFKQVLTDKLAVLPQPEPIQDTQGLEQMASNLTNALQEMISESSQRKSPAVNWIWTLNGGGTRI